VNRIRVRRPKNRSTTSDFSFLQCPDGSGGLPNIRHVRKIAKSDY
jgi:hypothetical protein